MSRSRSLFHRAHRRAATTLPRVAAALALTIAGLSSTACYEAKPLHLTVHTAATTLDCVHTVDRVFFDASYVRMSNVLGPNVFYTPRVSPPRQTTSTRTAVRLAAYHHPPAGAPTAPSDRPEESSR